MKNINKLYEKTIEDLTEDFSERIEKLKNAENKLKEELENKVTNVKENLEKTLAEINNLANMNKKINEGIKLFNEEEKNMIKILSYISKIDKNSKDINNFLKKSIKGIYFFYLKENSVVKYDDFFINDDKYYLNKIGKAIWEVNLSKDTQGRILFDKIRDKVYYLIGYADKKINVYKNIENLKNNNCDEVIELPHDISVNYSVIHKGYFYYFKYNTNNIVKYDLSNKKIILEKNILPDADLDSQNNSEGNNNNNNNNNNINLISDESDLYAVYFSNNNDKRITIVLLNENNFDVMKRWDTNSSKKKKCGPIFMIKGILYHIKTYNEENDAVIYSYDLEKNQGTEINIPFENKGGYDSSLTYYSHLKCLMTVNNYNIYKYDVEFDKSSNKYINLIS